MLTISIGSLLGLAAVATIANGTPSAIEQFTSPEPQFRPKFRYWMPDASVDPEVVRRDILSAAGVGSGGVEFLGFYEYGGSAPGVVPPNSDWSTYNFGTKPYVNLFKEALKAHEEARLTMDFAIGPNQGQGIPAHPETDGLQWDLVPFTQSVPANASIDGVLPGWGTGHLVSCVVAKVLSETNRSLTSSSPIGDTVTVNWIEYLLQNSSIQDITTQAKDGQVQLQLDLPTETSHHYQLYAFYEKLSGNKNLITNSEGNTTIFDHGSYAVDHFSKNGAEAVADFWEKHILSSPDMEDLIARVGEHAWEDSVEITSNISWTRSMPERFETSHGYSLRKYLPLLAFHQNTITLQTTEPGPFDCILDTEDGGEGIINDFRATLGEGYREYLQTITKWANQRLGVRMSVQPSYGLPLDLLPNVPIVDTPETESLSFDDSIDAYRQFVGPAHLAGKKTISSEVGAGFHKAYSYRIRDLLFSAIRGIVAGVNRNVIHGLTYSGSYLDTTWPGHTPFVYLFSDLLGPRLPTWNHGFSEALEYLSRIQAVHQQGTPQVDLAIYSKSTYWKVGEVYDSDDLIMSGWTYEYLSPANFKMNQAKVQNGRLAVEGPAYKALVIQSSQNVSIGALEDLITFANDGLPIILSGGLPGYFPEGPDSDDAEFAFTKRLAEFQSLENVHTVSTGNVSEYLNALGLNPRIIVRTNGTWYTTWRESAETSYAMVFADVATSSGEIIVNTTKTPYKMDPWTGEITPLLIYQQEKGDPLMRIPLQLAGNDTALFAFSTAFHKEIPTPDYHIQSVTTGDKNNIIGSSYDDENKAILLHIAHTTEEDADEIESIVTTLSNGRTVTIPISSSSSSSSSLDHVAPPLPLLELGPWSLTIEHWDPPTDLLPSSLESVKYNTTIPRNLTSPLTPWTQFSPELFPRANQTSGIGYYSTEFSWPPSSSSSSCPASSSSSSGAYLSFTSPHHHLLDSATVYINGRRLPPLDINNVRREIDISGYLLLAEEGKEQNKKKKNTVQVTVPTTLWNAVQSRLPELRSAGQEPLYQPLRDEGEGVVMEGGLVGGVVVRGFCRVGVV